MTFRKLIEEAQKLFEVRLEKIEAPNETLHVNLGTTTVARWSLSCSQHFFTYVLSLSVYVIPLCYISDDMKR